MDRVPNYGRLGHAVSKTCTGLSIRMHKTRLRVLMRREIALRVKGR